MLNNIFHGVLGVVFLLGLCYLFSANRKAISWKLVATGILTQVALALSILKFSWIKAIFEFVSGAFVKLVNLSHEGTIFLFGKLADPSGGWAYVFAIQVLPKIIFFAALSSLLYYLGVLQRIVYVFAWLLSKIGVSGYESVSAAANVFLGQTEAPLMVRPYLDKMTKSEMLCIMVGGMATTAGSVLAAYVGLLGGTDPVQQKFFALHLLTASVMAAPAAIVCSKMLFPRAAHEEVKSELNIPKERLGDNVLDAISIGTVDGLRLAVNVGAMLIVFTAMMFVANFIFIKIGDWTNINPYIANLTGGHYSSLSLQMILGYLFSPVAWIIGVNPSEMVLVGQLLGEKTILNEFFAYLTFTDMKNAAMMVDKKSILISTYALCGFANFASIGIQIGGISALAPNQRKNLSELGIRALVGGTIACLLNACIAGAIF